MPRKVPCKSTSKTLISHPPTNPCASVTRTRAQFIGINCCIKSIVEGPFTLIYIYAGELYPSSHRGTAVAFCNSFGRIGEWARRRFGLGFRV